MQATMTNPPSELGSEPSPSTPTPGVGAIALVAAVRDELGPIIKRLNLRPDRPWHIGKSAAKRTIVAGVTGVGKERAVEVFSALLEEHRPTHVIHLGYAGGLDPTLRAGTVLDIQWVIDGKGGAYALENGRPRISDGPLQNHTHATLLTMEHLIHSVPEKTMLFAQHRAGAVDMETFHVADLAARRGLHLRMLRAVSDPASMAIPAAAEEWIRPDGTDNVPAAIWHLITHPWKIPTTLRLARNVSLAGHNLARAVEDAIKAIG
jgi:adenosylhomocysteine nucleosidase